MTNLLIAFMIFASTESFAKSSYVRGGFKPSGSYTQSHFRSAPDGSKMNNYATKGNINPYTGKLGAKNP